MNVWGEKSFAPKKGWLLRVLFPFVVGACGCTGQNPERHTPASIITISVRETIPDITIVPTIIPTNSFVFTPYVLPTNWGSSDQTPAAPYPSGWTPTPLPTTTLLPPSSTATVVPYPELAGLVYWDPTSESLWQIQVGGEPHWLFDQPWVSISPSGTQVTYEQDGDIWVADLISGDSRNLTNTADRFECCPRWWPARPDIMLFGSGTESYEAFFPPRYLSSIKLDGTEYQVLDPERSRGWLSQPSASGEFIVYYGGYFLRWADKSIEQINVSEFGLGEVVLGAVALSPDDNHLAITVQKELDNQIQFGTAILNLSSKTGFTLDAFGPVGTDAILPAPSWHPGGDWIAFIDFSAFPEDHGLRILPSGGMPGEEFRLLPETNFTSLANLIWSPDGQFLAFGDVHPQRLLWLYAVGTWELRQFPDYPPGEVVMWVRIDGK